MGLRASPTVQLHFDDMRVPGRNLLGDDRQGFIYAMQSLDNGRLGIAAQAHRHRARGARGAAALRRRAEAVRQADQGIPGDPVQARRHGDAHRGVARAAARRRRGEGPRRADHAVRLDEQAARERDRDVGDDAGGPDLRRLRLREGLSGRAATSATRRSREIYEGTSEIQRIVIAASCMHVDVDGRRESAYPISDPESSPHDAVLRTPIPIPVLK